MKKYLNIGCGGLFDPSWTNVDLVSRDESIIAADITKSLPFSNDAYSLVYHSHVLEHLQKDEGVFFIEECHRVLQPGGIIRIAVPDLETMARLYLENLELAVDGDKDAANNYEWMLIELYDQATRTTSGGLMRRYLSKSILPAKDFVYRRFGENVKEMRRLFVLQKSWASHRDKNQQSGQKEKTKSLFSNRSNKNRHSMEEDPYYKLGRFRANGEVHQWMYDRYSLQRLLLETGFSKFKIRNAFESYLEDWSQYNLDSHKGKVRKPESIFVEAIKK